MKQHYLSRGFNFIVLSMASFMLVYSYIQLFIKDFSTSIESQMPQIGSVTGHQNVVKLKKAHLFSWLDVSDTQKVNADDLIFTYKDSTSTVMLGNDKTINIFPETMVQLKSADNLTLKKGKAEFDFNKKDSKLTIYLGNKKVTIQSDKAKIVIEKSKGKGKIRALSGVLKVKTDGQTYEVKKSEDLTITEKAVELSASDLVLNYPKDQSIEINLPKKKIEFSFSTPSQSDAKIEIANNERFIDPLFRQDVTDKEFRDFDLGFGKYYWRLVAKDINSQTAKFSIVYFAKPPQNTNPSNGFIMETFEKQSAVKFEWSSIIVKSKYQIEITDENDRTIVSEIINTNSYNWKSDVEGNFSWKVRAMDDYIEGAWSEKQNISILFKEYNSQRPMVIELAKPNQKVTINWDTDEDIKTKAGTIFTLAMDENFKTIVREEKVRSNSTSVVFPKIGKYYWKVNSYNTNTKIKPRTIIIRPTPAPKKPKALPNLKLKIKSKRSSSFNFLDLFISSAWASEGFVDLTWNKIEEANFYEIEIYTDKDLNNKILQAPSKDNAHQWKVPRAGIYYWRYRYKDYWGRYSPYSDASELQIDAAAISKKISQKTKKVKKPQIIKTKITKTLKDFKKWFGYSLSPTKLTFTQDTNTKFNIDGMALGSYVLSFGSKNLGKHNYDIEYSVVSGTVYDSEDFINRNLQSTYYYQMFPVTLTTGIAVVQNSSYQYDFEKVSFDKDLTGYGAFAGVIYKLDLIPILINFNYYFGTYKGYSFGGTYLKSFWDRYQLVVNATIQNHELKSDDIQLQISSFVGKLGVKYLF